CGPGARPVNTLDDPQGANAAASSEQRKVTGESASVPLDRTVALWCTESTTTESIAVSGGVVSTVNGFCTCSVFPAGSRARSLKTCGPSASAPVVCEVASVHEPNVSVSTRQANVTASSAEKVKVGVGSLVTPAGP